MFESRSAYSGFVDDRQYFITRLSPSLACSLDNRHQGRNCARRVPPLMNFPSKSKSFRKKMDETVNDVEKIPSMHLPSLKQDTTNTSKNEHSDNKSPPEKISSNLLDSKRESSKITKEDASDSPKNDSVNPNSHGEPTNNLTKPPKMSKMFQILINLDREEQERKRRKKLELSSKKSFTSESSAQNVSKSIISPDECSAKVMPSKLSDSTDKNSSNSSKSPEKATQNNSQRTIRDNKNTTPENENTRDYMRPYSPPFSNLYPQKKQSRWSNFERNPSYSENYEFYSGRSKDDDLVKKRDWKKRRNSIASEILAGSHKSHKYDTHKGFTNFPSNHYLDTSFDFSFNEYKARCSFSVNNAAEFQKSHRFKHQVGDWTSTDANHNISYNNKKKGSLSQKDVTNTPPHKLSDSLRDHKHSAKFSKNQNPPPFVVVPESDNDLQKEKGTNCSDIKNQATKIGHQFEDTSTPKAKNETSTVISSISDSICTVTNTTVDSIFSAVLKPGNQSVSSTISSRTNEFPRVPFINFGTWKKKSTLFKHPPTKDSTMGIEPGDTRHHDHGSLPDSSHVKKLEHEQLKVEISSGQVICSIKNESVQRCNNESEIIYTHTTAQTEKSTIDNMLMTSEMKKTNPKVESSCSSCLISNNATDNEDLPSAKVAPSAEDLKNYELSGIISNESAEKNHDSVKNNILETVTKNVSVPDYPKDKDQESKTQSHSLNDLQDLATFYEGSPAIKNEEDNGQKSEDMCSIKFDTGHCEQREEDSTTEQPIKQKNSEVSAIEVKGIFESIVNFDAKPSKNKSSCNENYSPESPDDSSLNIVGSVDPETISPSSDQPRKEKFEVSQLEVSRNDSSNIHFSSCPIAITVESNECNMKSNQYNHEKEISNEEIDYSNKSFNTCNDESEKPKKEMNSNYEESKQGSSELSHCDDESEKYAKELKPCNDQLDQIIEESRLSKKELDQHYEEPIQHQDELSLCNEEFDQYNQEANQIYDEGSQVCEESNHNPERSVLCSEVFDACFEQSEENSKESSDLNNQSNRNIEESYQYIEDTYKGSTPDKGTYLSEVGANDDLETISYDQIARVGDEISTNSVPSPVKSCSLDMFGEELSKIPVEKEDIFNMIDDGILPEVVDQLNEKSEASSSTEIPLGTDQMTEKYEDHANQCAISKLFDEDSHNDRNLLEKSYTPPLQPICSSPVPCTDEESFVTPTCLDSIFEVTDLKKGEKVIIANTTVTHSADLPNPNVENANEIIAMSQYEFMNMNFQDINSSHGHAATRCSNQESNSKIVDAYFSPVFDYSSEVTISSSEIDEFQSEAQFGGSCDSINISENVSIESSSNKSKVSDSSEQNTEKKQKSTHKDASNVSKTKSKTFLKVEGQTNSNNDKDFTYKKRLVKSLLKNNGKTVDGFGTRNSAAVIERRNSVDCSPLSNLKRGSSKIPLKRHSWNTSCDINLPPIENLQEFKAASPVSSDLVIDDIGSGESASDEDDDTPTNYATTQSKLSQNARPKSPRKTRSSTRIIDKSKYQSSSQTVDHNVKGKVFTESNTFPSQSPPNISSKIYSLRSTAKFRKNYKHDQTCSQSETDDNSNLKLKKSSKKVAVPLVRLEDSLNSNDSAKLQIKGYIEIDSDQQEIQSDVNSDDKKKNAETKSLRNNRRILPERRDSKIVLSLTKNKGKYYSSSLRFKEKPTDNKPLVDACENDINPNIKQLEDKNQANEDCPKNEMVVKILNETSPPSKNKSFIFRELRSPTDSLPDVDIPTSDNLKFVSSHKFEDTLQSELKKIMSKSKQNSKSLKSSLLSGISVSHDSYSVELKKKATRTKKKLKSLQNISNPIKLYKTKKKQRRSLKISKKSKDSIISRVYLRQASNESKKSMEPPLRTRRRNLGSTKIESVDTESFDNNELSSSPNAEKHSFEGSFEELNLSDPSADEIEKDDAAIDKPTDKLSLNVFSVEEENNIHNKLSDNDPGTDQTTSMSVDYQSSSLDCPSAAAFDEEPTQPFQTEFPENFSKQSQQVDDGRPSLNKENSVSQPIFENAKRNIENEQYIAENADLQQCIAENADAQQCIAENADAQQCIAENADAQQCIVENADAQQCIVENADAQQYIAENADAQQCIVENADAQQCIAENADAQQCIAENADAQQCIVENADAEQCIVENADAQQCIAENFDAQQYIAENADVQDCIAANEDIQQCEANNADIRKCIAENGDIQLCIVENADIQNHEAESLEIEQCKSENTEIEQRETEYTEIHKYENTKNKQCEAENTEIEQCEAENIEIKQFEAENTEIEQCEAENIEIKQFEAENTEIEQCEVENTEIEQCETQNTTADETSCGESVSSNKLRNKCIDNDYTSNDSCIDEDDNTASTYVCDTSKNKETQKNVPDESIDEESNPHMTSIGQECITSPQALSISDPQLSDGKTGSLHLASSIDYGNSCNSNYNNVEEPRVYESINQDGSSTFVKVSNTCSGDTIQEIIFSEPAHKAGSCSDQNEDHSQDDTRILVSNVEKILDDLERDKCFAESIKRKSNSCNEIIQPFTLEDSCKEISESDNGNQKPLSPPHIAASGFEGTKDSKSKLIPSSSVAKDSQADSSHEQVTLSSNDQMRYELNNTSSSIINKNETSDVPDVIKDSKRVITPEKKRKRTYTKRGRKPTIDSNEDKALASPVKPNADDNGENRLASEFPEFNWLEKKIKMAITTDSNSSPTKHRKIVCKDTGSRKRAKSLQLMQAPEIPKTIRKPVSKQVSCDLSALKHQENSKHSHNGTSEGQNVKMTETSNPNSSSKYKPVCSAPSVTNTNCISDEHLVGKGSSQKTPATSAISTSSIYKHSLPEMRIDHCFVRSGHLQTVTSPSMYNPSHKSQVVPKGANPDPPVSASHHPATSHEGYQYPSQHHYPSHLYRSSAYHKNSSFYEQQKMIHDTKAGCHRQKSHSHSHSSMNFQPFSDHYSNSHNSPSRNFPAKFDQRYGSYSNYPFHYNSSYSYGAHHYSSKNRAHHYLNDQDSQLHQNPFYYNPNYNKESSSSNNFCAKDAHSNPKRPLEEEKGNTSLASGSSQHHNQMSYAYPYPPPAKTFPVPHSQSEHFQKPSALKPIPDLQPISDVQLTKMKTNKGTDSKASETLNALPPNHHHNKSVIKSTEYLKDLLRRSSSEVPNASRSSHQVSPPSRAPNYQTSRSHCPFVCSLPSDVGLVEKDKTFSHGQSSNLGCTLESVHPSSEQADNLSQDLQKKPMNVQCSSNPVSISKETKEDIPSGIQEESTYDRPRSYHSSGKLQDTHPSNDCLKFRSPCLNNSSQASSHLSKMVELFRKSLDDKQKDKFDKQNSSGNRSFGDADLYTILQTLCAGQRKSSNSSESSCVRGSDYVYDQKIKNWNIEDIKRRLNVTISSDNPKDLSNDHSKSNVSSKSRSDSDDNKTDCVQEHSNDDQARRSSIHDCFSWNDAPKERKYNFLKSYPSFSKVKDSNERSMTKENLTAVSSFKPSFLRSALKQPDHSATIYSDNFYVQTTEASDERNFKIREKNLVCFGEDNRYTDIGIEENPIAVDTCEKNIDGKYSYPHDSFEVFSESSVPSVLEKNVGESSLEVTKQKDNFENKLNSEAWVSDRIDSSVENKLDLKETCEKANEAGKDLKSRNLKEQDLKKQDNLSLEEGTGVSDIKNDPHMRQIENKAIRANKTLKSKCLKYNKRKNMSKSAQLKEELEIQLLKEELQRARQEIEEMKMKQFLKHPEVLVQMDAKPVNVNMDPATIRHEVFNRIEEVMTDRSGSDKYETKENESKDLTQYKSTTDDRIPESSTYFNSKGENLSINKNKALISPPIEDDVMHKISSPNAKKVLAHESSVNIKNNTSSVDACKPSVIRASDSDQVIEKELNTEKPSSNQDEIKNKSFESYQEYNQRAEDLSKVEKVFCPPPPQTRQTSNSEDSTSVQNILVPPQKDQTEFVDQSPSLLERHNNATISSKISVIQTAHTKKEGNTASHTVGYPRMRIAPNIVTSDSGYTSNSPGGTSRSSSQLSGRLEICESPKLTEYSTHEVQSHSIEVKDKNDLSSCDPSEKIEDNPETRTTSLKNDMPVAFESLIKFNPDLEIVPITHSEKSSSPIAPSVETSFRGIKDSIRSNSCVPIKKRSVFLWESTASSNTTDEETTQIPNTSLAKNVSPPVSVSSQKPTTSEQHNCYLSNRSSETEITLVNFHCSKSHANTSLAETITPTSSDEINCGKIYKSTNSANIILRKNNKSNLTYPSKNPPNNLSRLGQESHEQRNISQEKYSGVEVIEVSLNSQVIKYPQMLMRRPSHSPAEGNIPPTVHSRFSSSDDRGRPTTELLPSMQGSRKPSTSYEPEKSETSASIVSSSPSYQKQVQRIPSTMPSNRVNVFHERPRESHVQHHSVITPSVMRQNPPSQMNHSSAVISSPSSYPSGPCRTISTASSDKMPHNSHAKESEGYKLANKSDHENWLRHYNVSEKRKLEQLPSSTSVHHKKPRNAEPTANDNPRTDSANSQPPYPSTTDPMRNSCTAAPRVLKYPPPLQPKPVHPLHPKATYPFPYLNSSSSGGRHLNSHYNPTNAPVGHRPHLLRIPFSHPNNPHNMYPPNAIPIHHNYEHDHLSRRLHAPSNMDSVVGHPAYYPSYHNRYAFHQHPPPLYGSHATLRSHHESRMIPTSEGYPQISDFSPSLQPTHSNSTHLPTTHGSAVSPPKGWHPNVFRPPKQ